MFIFILTNWLVVLLGFNFYTKQQHKIRLLIQYKIKKKHCGDSNDANLEQFSLNPILLYIFFQGSNLNVACNKSEVVVMVRDQKCSVTKLTDAMLKCNVPSLKYTVFENEEGLPVTVSQA